MSAILIRCHVSPGPFPSEYYISVNGSAAYYVNRVNVTVSHEPTSTKAVEGFVRGYRVQAKGNKVLVQLPGEAAVGGLRTWVDKTAVSAV